MEQHATMTERLAIIPARGNSKRLPRKNILPINGTPMIAFPIRACLESRLFDKVVVSTEDPEIAEIASAEGAMVSSRCNELTTDDSSIAEVCLALLQELADTGYRPDEFCCVYATAVFMTPADLANALTLLHNNCGTNMVMGVSKFNLQAHQAMFYSNGFLKPMWPELMGRKSQQMPELVASNGTLIWTRTDQFQQEGAFPRSGIRGYTIPHFRAIDIDTEEDYKLLSLLTMNRDGEIE